MDVMGAKFTECMDKAGWVSLAVVGRGPYRLDPEGYAWEVVADDDRCRSPDEFVQGPHSNKEMATAVAAFMNWWWRENQRNP